MRSNTFSSLVSQEIDFFDKNKTGELINRLSSDTTVISQSVTMNISDGLRSTVMVVAGIGLMVSLLYLLFIKAFIPNDIVLVLYVTRFSFGWVNCCSSNCTDGYRVWSICQKYFKTSSGK